MLYIIDQPLVQGVTWVLVYRTEKYIKLKSEIEKQSKKLEGGRGGRWGRREAAEI